MENGSLTLAAWSYGLGGLAYTAFASHLLQMLPRRTARLRLGAMFAVAALSAVWAWCGFAYGVTGDPAFLAAVPIADVLRYGGWYAFLLLLLFHPGSRGKALEMSGLKWILPATLLLAVVALLTLGFVSLDIGLRGGIARPSLFHMLAMTVLGLVLVEQIYRNVASDWLWSVKPLCLGLAGAFLFDLFFYSDAVLFSQPDPVAWTVRGAVHGLIVPLLALSVTRSHHWASRLRLSQSAALHTATLCLAGGYLLFISAVAYYVRYSGGEWGRALQLAIVFAALMALAVLACSASLRAKLRVLVRKHFFSYRYDYREEWLRFTRTLSQQNSPREMGQQVVRGLADMLESPAGGLWLRDGSQRHFVQAARWNVPAVAAREDDQSSLCRFLMGSGWVINLEEVRCFSKRYDSLELPAWLLELPNAWLVVPLLDGSEMVGFVVLNSPRARLEVNWEVNDLLKTAGRQAASFIAQMQATEALLEARKFEAFNRMSAFVVHDLKNIVSQLSLLLRNAERHRANPEFQQDMLMTVHHSVERMRQLMTQLRDGADPARMGCGVELARVIGRIQSVKSRAGRPIEVQIAEHLFTRGHEERIERVIGHLVQNAIDAIEGAGRPGRVWIKLERQGGQARIEVGDTGQGMSQEFIQEQLFKPFQTTKRSGMGIGAYESFQYVHELGGKMLVESEVDKGTRVTILLPTLDVELRSDLPEAA